MKDFSKLEFRASQFSKIVGGNIGLTDNMKQEMINLQVRKMDAATGGEDANGKPIKPLTQKMEERLNELSEINKSKELPKTMRSELRKIFRMEKYNRNFPFTNKYLQKGISEEEEAITLYQNYRNAKGVRTLFTKNTERLKNGWVSGEPDLGQHGVPILEWKEGWDTKCSWSLETFPFPEDDLVAGYETQNMVYMWLTGAEKWTTVSVLVNASEHLVNNEKLKHFYALQMPADADDKYWDDYQERCRDVEKMLIYDYDRFVSTYPSHDMVIGKDEWFGEGYDIPLEERVLEKTIEFDPKLIDFYKERIELAREYLIKLSEQ